MLKLSHMWVFGLLILPFFTISEIPFPYIYPKVFLLQAWAGLGLAISIFEAKKENIKLGPILLSCIGLFIMALISSFYAEDKIAAFFGPFWRGTGILFYFSCLLVWLNLKTSDFPREKFGCLLVHSGAIISLIAIFNWYIKPAGSSNTTLMGNQNALSFWIGGVIFLNYYFRSILGKNKFLYYGTFLSCAFAVIVLGSRSTLGGVILGGFLIGMFSEKRLFKYSLYGLGLSLLGLGTGYFVSKNSIISNMLLRFEQFHRKEIWAGAWDSFLAHPILGYGFHGLIQGYWENFPPKIPSDISWNDNAHSLPLNIAGEMGLLGIIISLLIAFYFIKNLLGKEKVDRAFWIGLGSYIFCYSLVQPFYIDTVVLLVFIGFLTSEKTVCEFSNLKISWISFKGISAVVLLVITSLQILQLRQINQTRRDIVSNKNYRRTWNQFMNAPDLLDKPGAFLEISNQMGAAFKGNTEFLKRLQKPMISFMLDQYSRNFESFKTRPRMYENYANWLTRGGKYNEGIAVLDRSLKRSDKITKSIYQKASIYVKLKDYRNAKIMLLKVKELNPNFPNLESYLVKLRNY